MRKIKNATFSSAGLSVDWVEKRDFLYEPNKESRSYFLKKSDLFEGKIKEESKLRTKNLCIPEIKL